MPGNHPSQSASQPLSEVNIAEAAITRLGQQGQMCLQGLTEWKVIYKYFLSNQYLEIELIIIICTVYDLSLVLLLL